jgi:hypothetical protein
MRHLKLVPAPTARQYGPQPAEMATHSWSTPRHLRSCAVYALQDLFLLRQWLYEENPRRWPVQRSYVFRRRFIKIGKNAIIALHPRKVSLMILWMPLGWSEGCLAGWPRFVGQHVIGTGYREFRMYVSEDFALTYGTIFQSAKRRPLPSPPRHSRWLSKSTEINWTALGRIL